MKIKRMKTRAARKRSQSSVTSDGKDKFVCQSQPSLSPHRKRTTKLQDSGSGHENIPIENTGREQENENRKRSNIVSMKTKEKILDDDLSEALCIKDALNYDLSGQVNLSSCTNALSVTGATDILSSTIESMEANRTEKKRKSFLKTTNDTLDEITDDHAKENRSPEKVKEKNKGENIIQTVGAMQENINKDQMKESCKSIADWAQQQNGKEQVPVDRKVESNPSMFDDECDREVNEIISSGTSNTPISSKNLSPISTSSKTEITNERLSSDSLGDLLLEGCFPNECTNCAKTKMEITTLKTQFADNFRLLKEKILTTSEVVKAYKQKCQEIEKQRRENKELKAQLEASYEQTATVRQQLKKANDLVEPLSKTITRLESDRVYANAQISELKNKLNAEEIKFSELSTSIGHNDLSTELGSVQEQLKDEKTVSDKLRKKNSSLEKSISRLNEKIKELRGSVKDKVKEAKAMVVDREIAKLQGKLNRSEKTIVRLRRELKNSQKVAKNRKVFVKSKKKESSFVRRIVSSSPSESEAESKAASSGSASESSSSSSSDDDFPTPSGEHVTVTSESKDQKGYPFPFMHQFSIVSPLSPIPPSPAMSIRNARTQSRGQLLILPSTSTKAKLDFLSPDRSHDDIKRHENSEASKDPSKELRKADVSLDPCVGEKTLNSRLDETARAASLEESSSNASAKPSANQNSLSRVHGDHTTLAEDLSLSEEDTEEDPVEEGDGSVSKENEYLPSSQECNNLFGGGISDTDSSDSEILSEPECNNADIATSNTENKMSLNPCQSPESTDGNGQPKAEIDKVEDSGELELHACNNSDDFDHDALTENSITEDKDNESQNGVGTVAEGLDSVNGSFVANDSTAPSKGEGTMQTKEVETLFQCEDLHTATKESSECSLSLSCNSDESRVNSSENAPERINEEPPNTSLALGTTHSTTSCHASVVVKDTVTVSSPESSNVGISTSCCNVDSSYIDDSHSSLNMGYPNKTTTVTQRGDPTSINAMTVEAGTMLLDNSGKSSDTSCMSNDDMHVSVEGQESSRGDEVPLKTHTVCSDIEAEVQTCDRTVTVKSPGSIHDEVQDVSGDVSPLLATETSESNNDVTMKNIEDNLLSSPISRPVDLCGVQWNTNPKIVSENCSLPVETSQMDESTSNCQGQATTCKVSKVEEMVKESLIPALLSKMSTIDTLSCIVKEGNEGCSVYGARSDETRPRNDAGALSPPNETSEGKAVGGQSSNEGDNLTTRGLSSPRGTEMVRLLPSAITERASIIPSSPNQDDLSELDGTCQEGTESLAENNEVSCRMESPVTSVSSETQASSSLPLSLVTSRVSTTLVNSVNNEQDVNTTVASTPSISPLQLISATVAISPLPSTPTYVPSVVSPIPVTPIRMNATHDPQVTTVMSPFPGIPGRAVSVLSPLPCSPPVRSTVSPLSATPTREPVLSPLPSSPVRCTESESPRNELSGGTALIGRIQPSPPLLEENMHRSVQNEIHKPVAIPRKSARILDFDDDTSGQDLSSSLNMPWENVSSFVPLSFNRRPDAHALSAFSETRMPGRQAFSSLVLQGSECVNGGDPSRLSEEVTLQGTVTNGDTSVIRKGGTPTKGAGSPPRNATIENAQASKREDEPTKVAENAQSGSRRLSVSKIESTAMAAAGAATREDCPLIKQLEVSSPTFVESSLHSSHVEVSPDERMVNSACKVDQCETSHRIPDEATSDGDKVVSTGNPTEDVSQLDKKSPSASKPSDMVMRTETLIGDSICPKTDLVRDQGTGYVADTSSDVGLKVKVACVDEKGATISVGSNPKDSCISPLHKQTGSRDQAPSSLSTQLSHQNSDNAKPQFDKKAVEVTCGGSPRKQGHPKNLRNDECSAKANARGETNASDCDDNVRNSSSDVHSNVKEESNSGMPDVQTRCKTEQKPSAVKNPDDNSSQVGVCVFASPDSKTLRNPVLANQSPNSPNRSKNQLDLISTLYGSESSTDEFENSPTLTDLPPGKGSAGERKKAVNEKSLIHSRTKLSMTESIRCEDEDSSTSKSARTPTVSQGTIKRFDTKVSPDLNAATVALAVVQARTVSRKVAESQQQRTTNVSVPKPCERTLKRRRAGVRSPASDLRTESKKGKTERSPIIVNPVTSVAASPVIPARVSTLDRTPSTKESITESKKGKTERSPSVVNPVTSVATSPVIPARLSTLDRTPSTKESITESKKGKTERSPSVVNPVTSVATSPVIPARLSTLDRTPSTKESVTESKKGKTERSPSVVNPVTSVATSPVIPARLSTLDRTPSTKESITTTTPLTPSSRKPSSKTYERSTDGNRIRSKVVRVKTERDNKQASPGVQKNTSLCSPREHAISVLKSSSDSISSPLKTKDILNTQVSKQPLSFKQPRCARRIRPISYNANALTITTGSPNLNLSKSTVNQLSTPSGKLTQLHNSSQEGRVPSSNDLSPSVTAVSKIVAIGSKRTHTSDKPSILERPTKMSPKEANSKTVNKGKLKEPVCTQAPTARTKVIPESIRETPEVSSANTLPARSWFTKEINYANNCLERLTSNECTPEIVAQRFRMARCISLPRTLGTAILTTLKTIDELSVVIDYKVVENKLNLSTTFCDKCHCPTYERAEYRHSWDFLTEESLRACNAHPSHLHSDSEDKDSVQTPMLTSIEKSILKVIKLTSTEERMRDLPLILMRILPRCILEDRNILACRIPMLCRVFTALCAWTDDLYRLRTFLYDLHVAYKQPSLLPRSLLAMVLVWPKIFDFYSCPLCQEITSSPLSLSIKLASLKQAADQKMKSLKILESLLGMKTPSHAEYETILERLPQLMLATITENFEETSTNTFEIVKAIELSVRNVELTVIKSRISEICSTLLKLLHQSPQSTPTGNILKTNFADFVQKLIILGLYCKHAVYKQLDNFEEVTQLCQSLLDPLREADDHIRARVLDVLLEISPKCCQDVKAIVKSLEPLESIAKIPPYLLVKLRMIRQLK